MNRRRPTNKPAAKPAERTGERDTRRALATREEVAEYLQLNVNTLAKWASEGTGPRYSRVGRHTRYRWADVERWLDQRQQTTKPDR